jgi:hypothetical protein
MEEGMVSIGGGGGGTGASDAEMNRHTSPEQTNHTSIYVQNDNNQQK